MLSDLNRRMQPVMETLRHESVVLALGIRGQEKAEAAALEAEAMVQAADVALAIVHDIRDAESARAQETITNLCTEALRIVFEDPGLLLEARSVERRGVVETDLVLVRGGFETDPLQSNGGGLVAVAAAMLRLVLVRLMSARGLAPLLVLDEPLAALSAGNRGRMAETLRQVAGSLGVQVIVVTHSAEEMVGDVYEVRWQDRDAVLAEVVRADA